MNRFVDFTGRIIGGEKFQLSQQPWVRYGLPSLIAAMIVFQIGWLFPVIVISMAVISLVDWKDYNRKYGDA